MCAFYLKNKLETLIELRQNLMTVLTTTKDWSHILALDEKVPALCDEFLEIVSWVLDFRGHVEMIHGSEWFSVPLNEWLERLQRSWKDELPQRWFDIPSELQNLEIWELWTRTYWLRVIGPLEWWWAAGHARLESVEWRLGNEYVELIATGSSESIGVCKVEVNESEQEFWILEVKPEAVRIPPNALAAELLAAQLAARQGGGRLTVEVFGGGQLSMKVSIPRADAVPPLAEGEAALPADVTRHILDRVLHMIVGALTNVGNRLKVALSEEIHRLESSAEGGEIEQIGKLQKRLDQLNLLLSALEDWLAYFWTEQSVVTVNVAERLQQILDRRGLEWTIHRRGDCHVRSQLHKVDFVLQGFLDGAIVLLGNEVAERGLEVIGKHDEVWVTVTSGGRPVTAVSYKQLKFLRGEHEIPGFVLLPPFNTSKTWVEDIAIPRMAEEILLHELGGWVDIQNTLGLRSYVRLHLPREGWFNYGQK